MGHALSLYDNIFHLAMCVTEFKIYIYTMRSATQHTVNHNIRITWLYEFAWPSFKNPFQPLSMCCLDSLLHQ